jgi:hypothetical protein
MSGKIKKIYEALIDGAQTGLTDSALYRHVLDECPKASSKKIVKASLLALSDPDLKDANILQVIYALAIKHRLDPATKEDIEEIEQPVTEVIAEVKKTRVSKKQRETQPAV